MISNYLQFIEEVKVNIQGILGENVSITTKEVTKNNGVVYIGLLIQNEGENVIPTIYMESYYKEYVQGKEFGDIIKSIIEVYNHSRQHNKMNMEFFSDYEKVKDKIAYKLIHFNRNKELLEQIPYIPYLNLAIVFYYICENSTFGRGTILIRNEYMKTWEISTQSLYEQTIKNMPNLLPYEWKNMEQIIEEMLGKEDGMKAALSGRNENSAMYVLTNQTKIYGAACILYEGILEEIWEKLGRDYFILPSSVHEVILIPKSGNESPDRLLGMVTEVNKTQVEAEEVLADAVYYYSKSENKVQIAAQREE